MPHTVLNRSFCALLALWLLSAREVLAEQPTVFVSFALERRIGRFAQQPETGRLTPLPSAAIPGHAGGMITDAARRFLLVALRGEGRLATFRIQPGGLSLISNVPAGEDPAYIALDRSGRFLLTAYYVANKVTVHKFGEDGTLGSEPLQTLPTAPNAHGVITDPTNRFVFVPHTSANAICQFRMEASSGWLTPNEPPLLERGPHTGPRHPVFHPRLPVLYVDNEQESSVSWYHVDTDDGTLTLLGSCSTLPAGFQGVNSNADVEIHPTGKFLYCSNRGHDSLATFAVDEQTGALTSLGQTPTETTPREFNIDSRGRFLYAAGEGSGRLAAFEIGEGGRPRRFATYEAGREPFWVLVVDPAADNR